MRMIMVCNKEGLLLSDPVDSDHRCQELVRKCVENPSIGRSPLNDIIPEVEK
jgi:hypothetical protein